MAAGNQIVSGEIDLKTVFKFIWVNKVVLLSVWAGVVFLSLWFALSRPNIYTSSVLLLPAESSGGGNLGALASQFGGLASLAGINVPGGASNRSDIALELLVSRAFAKKLIDQLGIKPKLAAAVSWDRSSGMLNYDTKIYSDETESWTFDRSISLAPNSDWEVYKKYRDSLSVVKDKSTGVVRLNFEYYSPALAKEWLGEIVVLLNSEMKQRDVKEARDNISYLENQLNETNVSEMRSVFYKLIEEQTKSLMLAEVKEQYVFEVLDGPVEALEKSKPSRPLIMILGFMLGAFLGLIVIVVLNLVKQC